MLQFATNATALIFKLFIYIVPTIARISGGVRNGLGAPECP